MDNSNKKNIQIAALLIAGTIAIGAFGAHGLKEIVSKESLVSFETGVRYQMYHALALLIIGFSEKVPSGTRKWVVRFFLFGILFFSGSIYLLTLKDLLPFDPKSLAFMTPVGGLLFILGWIRLAFGLNR